MIHPRRLKGKPGNLARYYTVGDYYTKGGEEPSQWGGTIAREFGLEGQVDPDMFERLLAGKVGGQQLGRHRANGEIEHHPGWDFAVNAPKSVSIMALVAGDERILAAHEKAVSRALDYLEEHATLRHRVDGKIAYETTGRLIFARFTEHASRELDPHLHTHVVVMNMTNRRGEEPMASLETRAMFAEQMVAGQIYRNELAHSLREAGYEIVSNPKSGLFEISGVPKTLIVEMSRRAEKIDAHAREHGLTGQAARRVSFYATRAPKEKSSFETLRDDWSRRLGDHRRAVDETLSEARERGGRSIQLDPATAARAMLFGLRHEEGKEAVNNLGRLFQRALASHVGDVRLENVRPIAQAHEAQRKLLVANYPTGERDLVNARASRRTARLELALSDHLALSLNDAAPISTYDRLREASAAHGLSEAQEAALLHIGAKDHRVTGIHGVAGAGKSTLIRALNEAAHPDLVMIALAPTSSAAANLGASAKIESRTVASLIAGGDRTLDDRHVLVLDEAGQLGNRQALRMLEISRTTGARLILLGDNRQTGAIEQGKAFWLLQRLGLPKAELVESRRQETREMKMAVVQARLSNYAASIEHLDKVMSGEGADKLAGRLVEEWTRLKPENRASTNILVLENATRLIVNTRVREALKSEGAVAAEDMRLSILTPAGLSEQEKRMARFYSGGQVLIFTRDNAGLGIAKDAEYRVVGLGSDRRGRQIVRIVDENGRRIDWDPRVGRASRVNVFKNEARDLAAGDRIQWRQVNHDLDIRNADRGTVEAMIGTNATIRWDRDGRVQAIDLSRHRNWDHGYAETVFSAQSKTYDRVYILAPVNSPLVTGQNYYTAITRARFGAKLWTEDEQRLVDRLERKSGEKTSALEGLGRVNRSSVIVRERRFYVRFEELRAQQRADRVERKAKLASQRERGKSPDNLGDFLAGRARSMVEMADRWIASLVRGEHSRDLKPYEAPTPADNAQPRGNRDDR